MIEFVVSLPIARYLVRQPVGSEHDVDVVPGLRHDVVQSFDVMVSGASGTELYTVVAAIRPALSLHDREVIVRALAATRRPEVVFVVDRAPGEWRAELSAESTTPSAAETSSAAAAAVGAVNEASGGNGAPPTSVTVGERRFQVTTSRDGQKWRCGVESLDPA